MNYRHVFQLLLESGIVGTISHVILVFCCDIQGSIGCNAVKCDVTQPCSFFF